MTRQFSCIIQPPKAYLQTFETNTRVNEIISFPLDKQIHKFHLIRLNEDVLNSPMMAPQCILAYGSSPVKISHIEMPNEKTSTYQNHNHAFKFSEKKKKAKEHGFS